MLFKRIQFYLFYETSISRKDIINFINSQPNDRLIDFSTNAIKKNTKNKCGSIIVHICRDIFKKHFPEEIGTYIYCGIRNINFDNLYCSIQEYFYNQVTNYGEVKKLLKDKNFMRFFT